MGQNDVPCCASMGLNRRLKRYRMWGLHSELRKVKKILLRNNVFFVCGHLIFWGEWNIINDIPKNDIIRGCCATDIEALCVCVS